jgi:hypothetical protein
MKNKFLTSASCFIYGIALCCFFNTTVKAQCLVSAFSSATTINCGDTIFLGASGNQATIVYTNNFNATCPGPGWTGTSSAVCTNPCGNGPSAAPGDPYLWMNNTATAPRNLTTVGYDVSNGGTICFDMRYASEESCPGPGACPATALTCSCEGPDLPDEGVHLQYQKNGAGPWIDIQYWDPNGGCDPNLINWNNHCVTIPPGAFGATTKFRWFQTASSTSDADHWGIDNVVITVPNLAYTFDWAHDAQAPNISPTTAGVAPTSTTTYTVTYTNGTCSTTGTVTVNVNLPAVTVTGGGTVCQGAPTQLVASSSLIMTCPTTCGLSGSASCNPANSKVGEHQVGAGTTVATCNNGGQDIFGDFNAEGAVRAQVIYTAAEILGSTGVNGSGAFTCGQLRGISFDFARLDNSGCSGTLGSLLYRNLEIRIACIGSKSTFTGTGDWTASGSLTTVYASRDVTVPGTGWKIFNFDETFNWDNTSNILVQICWRHNSGGQGSSGKVTTHAIASKVLIASTNSSGSAASWNCATSTSFATVWGQRPNTRFSFCEPVAGTLLYTWTPATGLNDATIYDPIATPTTSTTYTVSVNQSGLPIACQATGTATVTISPAPSLSLGYGSCSNGSTNLVANGLSYCNTTTTTAYNTNATITKCITVPAGIGTYPTALLSVFADITHCDITEVSNNAGTNSTIEIQGPGTTGWTTLTALTNGDKTWTGALPAGLGTPTAGTDVAGTWCIRFKDDDQAGGFIGSDCGGLNFNGYCLNFTNGATGVTYSWTGPSGTPSTNQMINTTATGVYTVTATNAAGCSSIATMSVTACGVVLPVELLSFEGQNLENKRVRLDWVTASEQNSDRFEIERSENSDDFITIGSVLAAGNSTIQKQYSFIDEAPKKDFNYYRLKQIDKDGKVSYSNIVPVELNKLITEKLRPVPATDKLFYDVNSPEDQNVMVEIFDLLGNKVINEMKSLKTGSNTLTTDVLLLPAGVYILKMSDSSGEPYIQKFIK